MSDNGEESKGPASRIVIEFVAPGAAGFNSHLENINPAQILAAAAYLDWYGRKMLDAATQKQAAQGIIVPQAILKTAH